MTYMRYRRSAVTPFTPIIPSTTPPTRSSVTDEDKPVRDARWECVNRDHSRARYIDKVIAHPKLTTAMKAERHNVRRKWEISRPAPRTKNRLANLEKQRPPIHCKNQENITQRSGMSEKNRNGPSREPKEQGIAHWERLGLTQSEPG